METHPSLKQLQITKHCFKLPPDITTLYCIQSINYPWQFKVIISIFEQISTSQFGFMKGRSTLQKLLIFLKDIYEHNIDCLLHLLAIASVEVHCGELDQMSLKSLNRLHLFGWCWFKSYLDPMRSSQWLFFNSTSSVIAGVPQGSVLGSLFTSIHPSLKSASDDTKCYKFIF